MAVLTFPRLRDDTDRADAALVSAAHASGAARLGELHALPDEPDQTLIDARIAQAAANAQAQRFILDAPDYADRDRTGPNLTGFAVGLVALAIFLGGPLTLLACAARLGWLA